MKLFIVLLISFGASVFGQKASKTIPIWPGTPPAAKAGDDALALKIAKSIKEGTYKIPKGNRRNIRVPVIDVYLPPKDKQTGTAIVLCCGGGYGAVCTQSEGLPITRWLNKHGISVFMLSYRCRPYNHPVPFWDVQRAMRLVRHHAKEFNIKPDQIGVMGFSAGGHVASSISVHYKENFERTLIDDVDKVSARPDFSCLIFPVISMRAKITHGGSRRNLLGKTPAENLVIKLSNDEHINKQTPPAFLAHAKTDRVVKIINSQNYHDACRKNGVESKMIIHDEGGHGPGTLDGKPSISRAKTGYADELIKWIKAIVKKEK